ncbi:MAG: CRR6 family NdhI maturation factor [Pseudanabaenaceae cyanobacterium bins.68]|nr:CRR6 family NdhI maturation factor [Pseudanabaenaceae cyanobacterium bins.68]
MSIATINLNTACIDALDLAPARIAIDRYLAQSEPSQIRFEILYPRSPEDPRELSEIPEVRLWFIRLDAAYPWLPYLLDWKGGELTRYAAMLVPHSFTKVEGIEFNPEALQIFVLQKLFVIHAWLGKGSSWTKLQQMAQVLGYEIDPSFFELL